MTTIEEREQMLRLHREHEKLLWSQRVSFVLAAFVVAILVATIIALWLRFVWTPLWGG